MWMCCRVVYADVGQLNSQLHPEGVTCEWFANLANAGQEKPIPPSWGREQDLGFHQQAVQDELDSPVGGEQTCPPYCSQEQNAEMISHLLFVCGESAGDCLT